MFSLATVARPTIRRAVPAARRHYASPPPADGPTKTADAASGVKMENVIVGGIGAALIYYVGRAMLSSDASKEESKA
ncbi:hypothetical protein JCM8202_001068 [Rhodotorula sphaerocarpa]